jgi:hypothetical protein
MSSILIHILVFQLYLKKDEKCTPKLLMERNTLMNNNSLKLGKKNLGILSTVGRISFSFSSLLPLVTLSAHQYLRPTSLSLSLIVFLHCVSGIPSH